MELFSLSDVLLLVVRNTTQFCTLIFYSATLLNLLTISNKVFYEVFRIFLYIISCQGQRNIILLLLFWFRCILLISCLIALRFSIPCWIRVVRGAPLSYSWTWRESFQLFTIKYNVSIRFVICGLYYIEVCSFYTHFVENFLSWNDVRFCPLLFLYLLRWS